MLIPSTSEFCPTRLLARSFGSDVKSTAQSFRSWDTCMDNRTCKIVAIVGIVLAGLFLIWIISTIIRCVCLGFSCLEALCCCCCRSVSRRRYQEKQMPYNNPAMYAPPTAPQYTREPQQAYFTPQQGYQPVNTHNDRSYYNDEDPFKEGYRNTDITHKGNNF